MKVSIFMKNNKEIIIGNLSPKLKKDIRNVITDQEFVRFEVTPELFIRTSEISHVTFEREKTDEQI